MTNIAALFAVAFIVVLGICSVFAITAHGATAGTAQTDTFGNTPPAEAVAINNGSSSIAIKSSSILMYAPFILIVAVIIIAGSIWLWNSGRMRKSNGY